MNKPIYDRSCAIIGHILDTTAVTFFLDRNGNTAFFYNKVCDKTFDRSGQLLANGNQSLELLKNESPLGSPVGCPA